MTFVDFFGIGSSCFVRTVLNKLTCIFPSTACQFDIKSVLIRWKLRLVFGRKVINKCPVDSNQEYKQHKLEKAVIYLFSMFSQHWIHVAFHQFVSFESNYIEENSFPFQTQVDLSHVQWATEWCWTADTRPGLNISCRKSSFLVLSDTRGLRLLRTCSTVQCVSTSPGTPQKGPKEVTNIDTKFGFGPGPAESMTK